MAGEESTQNGGSSNPNDRIRNQLVNQINAERRVGNIPGAGPKGSRMLSYEELPNNPEALKHLYLELQRTLRDTHPSSQRKAESSMGG